MKKLLDSRKKSKEDKSLADLMDLIGKRKSNYDQRQKGKMMQEYINTVNFGRIPIRKTYKEGKHIADIELLDGDNAEVRLDYRTNQLFAVLFDGNWNEK